LVKRKESWMKGTGIVINVKKKKKSNPTPFSSLILKGGFYVQICKAITIHLQRVDLIATGRILIFFSSDIL